jgi:DUF4097 and DUF4098 domain-containing protein YvlB
MWNRQQTFSVGAGVFVLLLATQVAAFSLNKSIKLDDGSESNGHSTVNGSITVGNDARVDGSLETVNGTIRVGNNSTVEQLETVNGSIRVDSGVSSRDISSVNGSVRLAERVTVDGGISVVNGKIGMQQGSSVKDNVSNVNGEIEISGAVIGGDLTTVNGDVSLSDNAVLRGDLVVENSRGWNSDDGSRRPKIVIGPGCEVLGEIRLEREAKLYISETASVAGVSGEMSMEDAIRFSGNRP